MDEPFGAVDPLNRYNLQTEFLNLQKKLNKTIIFVTHDVDEAIRMGDKIVVMSKGEVEYFGDTKNILGSGNDFVKKFIGSEGYIKLLSKYKVKECNYEKMEDFKSEIGKEFLKLDIEDNLKDVLSNMIKNTQEEGYIEKDGKIIGKLGIGDILKMVREG